MLFLPCLHLLILGVLRLRCFRHTDAWLMILGTAQGCNQWNPYERRRAAKAETLACHSSTRGVFFMLAWGGHHDPRCPSRLAFTVAPQHFSLKVGAVELADQESAGRSQRRGPALPISVMRLPRGTVKVKVGLLGHANASTIFYVSSMSRLWF